MPAYFDTNVIRYLRTGLDAPLSADLQSRIVVSPISAIEVLSQVADPIYGDDALQSIHRFRHWLGPQAVMFDWLGRIALTLFSESKSTMKFFL